MANNDNRPNDDSKPTPDYDGETFQDHDDDATEPKQPSIDTRYRDIGPFRILAKIGEGGMGVVFSAEQIEPIRRRVALKVIKSGANSEKVVARFNAERQALAMMDHQNIAKILDAGTTEDGLPYFAMELVDGIPLHKYCDRNRLSISQRLQLFLPICRAVQHAHQKGIIHRDLKPSNVLVVHNNGNPIVKVIDFGLAKAVDHQNVLADQSLQTEFGKIVGTVQYMSPEQAGSGQIDIDTRTDVYSLGVILYELLTGSIPLDASTLGEKALLHVLEVIRDHQPIRPSIKLGQSSDSMSYISERRRIAPNQLQNTLKGDLDWIVMKAIEKDRDRRYESASSFADDIKRYLDSEVVLASPPAVSYRLRKFIGRNRLLVATSSIIALLLVSGTVGTGWFAYQADAAATSEKKQKEIAVEKSKEAKKLSEAAQIAQKQAEDSAKRASEVLKIVTDSFQSTNPNEGADAQMKAKDVLLNAKQAMESSELDDIGKADLLDTLTVSFDGIGEVSAAVQTGQQSVAIRKTRLGEDHRDTVNSMNNLGGALLAAGKIQEATELFERTLELRKESFGDSHGDTLDSMNNLAMAYQNGGRRPEANELLKTVFETSKQQKGLQHIDTLTFMNNLAMSYQSSGYLKEALQLYTESLAIREELYPDHPGTLINMSNIAQNHKLSGKAKEAIKMFQSAVKKMNEKLGAKHPHTLATKSNLANALSDVSQFEKAIDLLQETLVQRQAKLGELHPETLDNLKDLAGVYLDSGQIDKSVPLYEKTLRLMEQVLDAGHPDTLGVMNDLARAYGQAGKVKEEAALHEKTFLAMKNKLGEDHVYTLSSMVNLAGTYVDTGRVNEAIELYEKAVQGLTQQLGAKNPQTLVSAINLGGAYRAAGFADKAIAIYEKNLPIMQELFGPDHPNTIGSQNNLAKVYLDNKKFELAIKTFERSLQSAKKTLGDEHPYSIGGMINLASAYNSAGRLKQAIELFESANKVAKTTLGEQHPYTLASATNLATAYGKQGRNKEAIDLLENVVKANQQVFGDHPNTFDSVHSLAIIYQSDKQTGRAIELFESNFQSRKKLLGSEHPSTIESMQFLASALKEDKQWDKAVKLMRNVLELQEKNDEDSPPSLLTKARIGALLNELGTTEEAEPYLLSSYEALKLIRVDNKNEVTDQQYVEVLGYLIEMAKSNKDNDRAESWRRELLEIEKSKSNQRN